MHTVISAFDDRQQAERAIERLVERGFDRDHIHLEPDRGGRPAATPAAPEEEGFFFHVGQFFRDLFGAADEHEAGRYAEAVRRGGHVVVVDAADGEGERARAVLEELGGSVDLEERETVWRQEGWTGSAGRAATEAAAPQGERESVLPVLQEELQVGKRTVQRGGVRVLQRVTETPVKEMVRLREERAVVERRPVDRAASEADFANFREGTLEVRETVEEPVVSKAARVVEEVVVGKQVEERTETVSDTVRRTDVEVEPLGAEAQATRTRIRSASEDAAQVAGDALDRAERSSSDKEQARATDPLKRDR